ncbi:hypothetical protein Pcinc_034242, partial [Petrolisthes cinctipes]
MGCSESKDLRPISISEAQKKLESSIEGLEVTRLSSSSSSSAASVTSSSGRHNASSSGSPLTPPEEKSGVVLAGGEIPASLESIPNNDLG